MKNLLTIALAIGFINLCYGQNPSGLPRTLKEAAGFYVGTATSARTLMMGDTLRSIILDEFNSITLSNEMKMNMVMPRQGEYRWDRIDSTVAFCQRNNFRLFGHALIWHSSTPQWLNDAGHDSTSLSNFMKEYIHTYVSRYKGVVNGWDVVNEAITDSAGAIRQSFWYNILGESYLDQAFIAAHEADPNAVLFINDYNIERDTLKLNATLDLIERMKKRGVPVTGIGLQMHIRMDIPDEIIAHSLRKAAATGLQVHLSEVDIIFNRHNDQRGGGEQIYNELTQEMLQAQAEKYRNLARMYRTIVPKEQQYGITFWGFDDRTTWIRGFFRLRDWPCIFDDKFQKKPAYYGFMEGLVR